MGSGRKRGGEMEGWKGEGDTVSSLAQRRVRRRRRRKMEGGKGEGRVYLLQSLSPFFWGWLIDT